MKKVLLSIVIALVVLIVLIAMVAMAWISFKNGIISQRENVDAEWSQVENQLKRRADLIPNLVNTVKGYAQHERETLEKIVQARSQAMNAQGIAEQAEAENMLSGTLKSLFALAENYPELKADANFRQLQEELGNTENKIAFARQFYNDTVQKYNIRRQVFPAVLIAGMMGFEPAEYFNVEGEAREAVTVDFN